MHGAFIAAKARHLTDDMLWAVCQALSRCAAKGKDAPLLPHLSEVRKVSYHIAIAVVEEARPLGEARVAPNLAAEALIKEVFWVPYYRPILAKKILGNPLLFFLNKLSNIKI